MKSVCVYTYSIQYSFICICIDDTYLTWLKIRSLPKDVSKFLMRWATLTLLDGSERGNLIRYDATEEWEETETNHYVRIWILSEFCHLPPLLDKYPPLFSSFFPLCGMHMLTMTTDGRDDGATSELLITLRFLYLKISLSLSLTFNLELV